MSILFKTERFIIRELRNTDLEGFADLQCNKNAMDMVPDKTMTLEEAKIDLDIRTTNYTTKINDFDVWAVIAEDDNEFMGTCAIIYRGSKGVEIGYRIREKHWNKGVATEVAKGLINYIFIQTNQQTIIADVSKSNIGSVKVLQKFLTKVNEGYCEEYKTYDYNYELKKSDYNKL
jgi:RimJ/RimL family protein N-acetyltransferase